MIPPAPSFVKGGRGGFFYPPWVLPLRVRQGENHFESSPKQVVRSDRSACRPGKKAGAEAKKGGEKISEFHPLCLCRETRWQRDRRLKRRKPAVRKGEPLHSLARQMLFWPGLEPKGRIEEDSSFPLASGLRPLGRITAGATGFPGNFPASPPDLPPRALPPSRPSSQNRG